MLTVETVLFGFLALVALTSAILMITRRNPIHSVLYLIVNFFSLAVLYLTLQAQFIAVIQILVYAGAIMVLFLFVIMLLNLAVAPQRKEKREFTKLLAVVLSVTMAFEILYVVRLTRGVPIVQRSEQAGTVGTVEFIGKELFTKYLFPFEVTSILLLAAIVGAIVLAQRKFQ
ncbi:MAG: NADH-quinone oxidoreductase subunit J [Bacteroidota bacterium]